MTGNTGKPVNYIAIPCFGETRDKDEVIVLKYNPQFGLPMGMFALGHTEEEALEGMKKQMEKFYEAHA